MNQFFEKPPINHFKARFLIELEKRDMSIAQVARNVGKSPQHLSQVIDRGDPKSSVLRQLAESIGLETEDLLREVTLEEFGEIMIPRLTKSK